MRVLRHVCAAALLLFCACSGIEGLSGGQGDAGAADAAVEDAIDRADAANVTDAPTASDAPPGDGGSEGGAGDAGADADPNLEPNASFENGTGGCGTGWTPAAATLTRSPTARTGTASCLVCPSPTTSTFFEVRAVSAVPVAAGSYYAEAWLRAPPSGNVAGSAGVQAYFHPADGGATSYSQGTMVTPTATWTASSKAFVIEGGGELDFYVHAYFPDGGCVLVDDVALYRQ